MCKTHYFNLIFMTPLELYRKSYVDPENKFDVNIEELHKNAVDYLQTFMVAAELDVQAEKVSTYFEVKDFKFTRKFISESKNEYSGFALYLKDFRTPLCDKLRQNYLKMFAYAVFKLKRSFEEARDRLLELSGEYQLAALDPLRAEVCRFILCHFDFYAKDKTLLREIFRKFKRSRKKARKLKQPVPRHSAEDVLYKACQRRLFWWFFCS